VALSDHLNGTEFRIVLFISLNPDLSESEESPKVFVEDRFRKRGLQNVYCYIKTI
jgi:hypothetical protein